MHNVISKSIIVCIIYSTLFNSCKEQEKVLDLIDLTSISEISKIDLSIFADEIKYIPLETKRNSMLRLISRPLYTNGYFFLSDSEKLLKFTLDGKFKCTIGKKGRGPGEYNYLTSYCINDSSGDVYILDNKTIKIYNSQGKYLREFVPEIGDVDLSKITFVEGNILIRISNSSGKSEYSYLIADTNGEVKKKFRNNYKFKANGIMVLSNESHFYNYDENLHCKEFHSDTIFVLKNQNLIPKYIFKQGDRKFTTEIRSNIRAYHENAQYYIFLMQIFETSNFLFISYTQDGKWVFLTIDKQDNRQMVFDVKSGLINDIDGGLNFQPQHTVSIDGIQYLIGWFDTYELILHVESEAFRNSTPKYPEKKKELKELAASIDENDNPVLMLVKLKE